MGRQLTIKEIAVKAGVSAGTVDRVLHNRGKVAPDKEARVKSILEEIDFKLNLHTSAISIKKNYDIIICTPEYGPGEYWGMVNAGIRSALEEYNDLNITCTPILYDQFNDESCRKAHASVLRHKADAVIIGPVFESETRSLCLELDKKGTPYAFVDSAVEGTSPIASYIADNPAGGILAGKLLENLAGKGAGIMLCRPEHKGFEHNTQRLQGFYDYIDSAIGRDNFKEVFFSMDDSEGSSQAIMDALIANPGIKGIAILNSRGYFVADILSEHHRNDIKVISFDLSYNNSRCLKNDSIHILLSQRPATQGFNAVKALIEYIIYRDDKKTFIRMPIDILMKDNLPFYKESQI
ncbi:MAG: substrate-binding domain-containing protein [Bacteroidales bacterium]|nr:substrate-binding domain-containing protein [Bacteroidales bacterium]